MSENIWSVLLSTTIGPAVLLVIGAWLNRRIGKVEKTVDQTRDQVVNSHGTNFRDDVDGVKSAVDRLARSVDTGFIDVSRRFDRHERRLDDLSKDMSGVRDEIGQLRKSDREIREEIQENTAPRPGVTGRPRRRT